MVEKLVGFQRDMGVEGEQVFVLLLMRVWFGFAAAFAQAKGSFSNSG